jgi:hypothetical protein
VSCMVCSCCRGWAAAPGFPAGTVARQRQRSGSRQR